MLPSLCGPGSRLYQPPSIAPELPAWLPDVGEVGSVSLNTLADVDPENDALVNPSHPSDAPWHAVEGQSAVLDDWCGGVWAPDYSDLGALIAHGGGHNGYFGNEVYVWDADTRSWVRINDPTYPFSTDFTEGELATGKPMATHTYDHVQYVQPGMGGGTKGSFALLVHTSNHNAGGGFTGRSHICDLDTGVWARFSTNRLSITGVGENSTCYDSLRDRYYYIQQGFKPVHVLSAARAWSQLGGSVGPFDIGSAIGYDATGDVVVVFDPFNDRLSAIDQSDGSETVLTKTGTPPPMDIALQYVAESDAFYVFHHSDLLNIFKLKPPVGNKAARLAGTWTWSSETFELAAGSDSLPTVTRPVYSRFRYAAALRAFVVVFTTTSPVFAYRHPDLS